MLPLVESYGGGGFGTVAVAAEAASEQNASKQADRSLKNKNV